MSEAFSFNRENAQKVLKVFIWTTASALVAMIISLVAVVEVAPQYLFIVPIVNTMLYALKEWVTEQAQV